MQSLVKLSQGLRGYSMSEQLIEVLKKMFTTHRVIFWYDEQEKMREVYDDLSIAGVEKILLSNNEFGTKVQILTGEHTAKYLLYSPHPKPDHKDNWLLDILLANTEFSSSMPTIYLNEFEWPRELLPFIESHEFFFNSADRRKRLAALIENHTDPGSRPELEQKMLSILCSVEDSFDHILFKLFSNRSSEEDKLLLSIEKSNLSDSLWSVASLKFGYKEDQPTVKSLIYHIFESAAVKSIGSNFATAGANQSYIFAENWQNNAKHCTNYDYWADKIATDLNLGVELSKSYTPADLVYCDTYDFVDKIIINNILHQINNKSYKLDALKETISIRRTLHYYPIFETYYEALSYGLELLEQFSKLRIHISDAKSGFNEYTKSFAHIDFMYRKFVYFSSKKQGKEILADIIDIIEKKYTNDYLLELSSAWQKQIDTMDEWSIGGIKKQTEFYDWVVDPVVSKGNRLLVIISDGLRYETALELQDLLIAEDRYSADLDAYMGSLPTYTQLGMASLLPHNKITFENNTDTVFLDGQSSQGTENRTKILQKRHARSVAMSYEDFINLNRETGRDFIKSYDAIYVYKNKIDKIGDEKSTEHEVCKITEEELADLVDLLKHANNLNIYNMVITADHGFIYQNSRLDNTDFTINDSMGDKYKVNRRFIIGKNLHHADNMKKFTASQAGFADDTEILVPKGTGRLRVKGAGSRYVHGGAALQEIVIPVLAINKARKNDIEYVDIAAIFPRNVISSNIIGIEFFQRDPVAGKLQPRTIMAAFYDSNGNKISDEKTIEANLTDTDNANRTLRYSFSFGSDSSKLDGQRVYLKLMEPILGTSRFKEYSQYEFDMKIAFSNEFDSF